MAIKIDHSLEQLVPGTGVLRINVTGALTVPVGSDGDRPGTPAAGMFRYNSGSSKLEYYNGTAWTDLATGAGVSEPANQIVYGTGTTVDSSATFTYNVTTGALTLAASVTSPADTSITAASHSGTGNGAALTLSAGSGAGAGGAGGTATLRGGASADGHGGSVDIIGRNAAGTDRNGGNVNITAGTRTGTGAWGSFSVTTGGTERLEITGVGEWQIGGSVGTAEQVLTSGGSGTAVSWQSVSSLINEPANQLVYGTGTGITSSSTFTYNTTTGALTFAAAAVATPGDISLTAASASAAAVGGDVSITAGAGFGANAGGAATLLAGAGGATGSGGLTTVQGGAGGGTSGNGGGVDITAGSAVGTGVGGDVTITTGSGTTVGSFIVKTGSTECLEIAGNGEWQLGGAPGSNGQVLTSGGAGVAPTWVTIPSAGLTQHQVGIGSASNTLTGDADFTYNATTGALYVNTTNGTSGSVTSATPGIVGVFGVGHSGTGAGGAASVTGGTGGGTGAGGAASVAGGTGGATDGTGGAASLSGGAGGVTNGAGGAVNITAGTGQGSGAGGTVVITAGPSGTGTAGSVRIVTAGTERLEILGNGAWEVGGATGSSADVLTSNGGSAAPTWQSIGSLTSQPLNQIAYGTGSGLSSDADFTYANTTGALYVNTTNGTTGSVTSGTPAAVGIFAAGHSGTGTGGAVTIRAGAGGATSGAGGAVTIAAGTPVEGAGGSVNITASAGVGTLAVQNGGNVTITAGAKGSLGGTDGVINLVIPANGELEINGAPGSAGQYLTSNGPAVAPTWTTLSQPTTQVVYGTGTGISSEADFTWTAATNTMSVGSVATPATIRSPDGSSSAGANLSIVAGNGAGTDQAGGNITITAGTATGSGTNGIVTLQGGNGDTFQVGASIIASAGTFFRVNTNSSERLEITSTGAWEIGGTAGTLGQVLRTDGSGVPAWYTMGSTDIYSALGYTPVNRAGDTMTGNLTMNAGTFVVASTTPTSPNHLTNKAYVDSLVTSGAIWIDPIRNPDLVGIAANEPTASGAGYGAQNGAPLVSGLYIAYGGSYPQHWHNTAISATVTSVTALTDKILITGVDRTADFPAAAYIVYAGGTASPGVYSILSSTFTGGNTEIVTNENITVDSTGGTVYATHTVAQYDAMHWTFGNWEKSGNINSATATRYGVGIFTDAIDNNYPLPIEIRGGQTQANYNGVGDNGTFGAGSGYSVNDVITLSDGSTITVNSVTGGPSGPVATFTVTTVGVGTQFPPGNTPTLTQTGVVPAGGTGFTLSPSFTNGANVRRDVLLDDIAAYVGGVGGNPLLNTSWETPNGMACGCTFDVTSVTSGTKTFTLASSEGDLTNLFFPGNILWYAGGTPATSDGTYTIATVTWSSPNTVITVVETVPASTTGGTVESPIEDGATTLVNNPNDSHYGQSFLYNQTAQQWVQIAGPGVIGAGVGLSYSGTTLNVNLGAGIREQPNDEVGLDIYGYTSSAIAFADSTTGNRIVTSTAAASGDQLRLFLDGSTMTQSGTGLKVASAGITATELNTSVAGAGITGGGGTALSLSLTAAELPAIGSTVEGADRLVIYDDSANSTGGVTLTNVLAGLNLGTTSNAVFGTVQVSGVKLDDTDSIFFLNVQSTSTLTADRTLTIDVDNGARTLELGNDLRVRGTSDAVTFEVTSPATGSVLSYNGTDWVDATVASLVTAPNTEIVYGTGSGLSSDADFTYNATTGAFSVNALGAVAAPGDVVLKAFNSNTTAVDGGNIEIRGGWSNSTGTGNGGDVSITAGVVSGTAEGFGGNVSIQAGTGNKTGETGRVGGDVSIQSGAAGAAGGDAGFIELLGGTSTTGEGGYIRFAPGAGAGTNDGFIRLDFPTNGTLQIGTDPGTSGYVLTSGGGSGPPTWTALPATTVTENEIAYGDGSNAITSSAAFMVDPTAVSLTVDDTTSGGNATILAQALVGTSTANIAAGTANVTGSLTANESTGEILLELTAATSSDPARIISYTVGSELRLETETGTGGNAGEIVLAGGNGVTTTNGGVITLQPGNNGAGSGNNGWVRIIGSGNSFAPELRFYDADASNYTAFKAADTTTTNETYVLPATDGTSGQVLSTNGSGVLSWANNTLNVLYVENPSSPTTPTATGANAVAIGSGADATAASAFSIGTDSAASAADAVAIGTSAAASAAGAVAIGTNAAASAADAIAMGQDARATLQGSMVFANGSFGTAGDVKTAMYVLRATTTTDTQTTMNTPAAITIASDTTVLFNVKVVARRTDADNESAGYQFEGVIDNNAGTTAIVGTVAETIFGEDNPGWSVVVDADDSSETLRIRVTGENSKDIRWVAFVRTVEVTG